MIDDEPTDYQIAALMCQMGGSFVARLADAWMVAELHNRARIKAAFPDYWEEYREVVVLRRQLQKGTDDPPVSL